MKKVDLTDYSKPVAYSNRTTLDNTACGDPAPADERARFKAHFIAEGWDEQSFERYDIYDPDDVRSYKSRHVNDMWDGWKARAAITQQAAPAAEKQSYTEADGCPTERAVLQRFWREHQSPVAAPAAPNGQQAHVLPPTRGTDSQHDATIAQLASALRSANLLLADTFVSTGKLMTERASAVGEQIERALAAADGGELASRGRARGGNTNDDERTDEALRLRRIVRALGMDKEVPDNDATLRDCLFSVLGMIAGKLERASQAATTASPEILVVNEDGIELAIERRADGKWVFMPTTFDGQRPRINPATTASASGEPDPELAAWNGLTDLFAVIAAKHGIKDIQVNHGTADELFPRVLAEFIVAASRTPAPSREAAPEPAASASGEIVAWLRAVEPGEIPDWPWPFTFVDAGVHKAMLDILEAFPVYRAPAPSRAAAPQPDQHAAQLAAIDRQIDSATRNEALAEAAQHILADTVQIEGTTYARINAHHFAAGLLALRSQPTTPPESTP